MTPDGSVVPMIAYWPIISFRPFRDIEDPSGLHGWAGAIIRTKKYGLVFGERFPRVKGEILSVAGSELQRLTFQGRRGNQDGPRD
jgi:hypothetical protein